MTTNRAFIKAYRQDAAQSVPMPPALAGSPRTAAAASASIQLVASASDFQATALGQPLSLTAPLSESIDVLPPASAAFVETTLQLDDFSARPALPAASADRVAVSTEERIAGRKRPLSDYIGRPSRRPAPAIDSHDNSFRPGTTVASFRWPSICRLLAQECRAELDGVGDFLLSEAEQGSSVIGLVGLFPGSGATTTLIALAARLALRKRRILLVDGNFQRPQLAALLDVVPTAGWQEVLAGGAPLSDAVIRAADDSIDVLALGANSPEDVLRLVAGPQVEAGAAMIRRQYDLTLVDLGAFFDATSKPIMLELIRNMRIGGALAMALPEETDSRDLDTLADELGRSGCDLLGRIENRVVTSQAKL
ncbi:MAG TPA: cellulose synthase operon protein YhjQ/BcsQ [Lacipirellulaceae bacterium]|nr:cellulose synthase operon protein YhjQ/BcsQ [Lacipirellulaceae bacterium]